MIPPGYQSDRPMKNTMLGRFDQEMGSDSWPRLRRGTQVVG